MYSDNNRLKLKMKNTFISGPQTITILPTYRCTAACEQCCFGSNPQLKERLSLEEILNTLQEAKDNFSSLKQVVFSGGECVMLGDDLFASLKKAHSLGLLTRIVSNGYWGASKNKAANIAKKLCDAGLRELNISTGRDHAQFVKIDSVLNAACAAVDLGIFVLITAEQDSEDSSIVEEIKSDPRFNMLSNLPSDKFKFQVNSWMKFNENHKIRNVGDMATRSEPCTQLFSNIVVTPHKNISACCGLTFEHIPEMRIGAIDTNGLNKAFESSANDFMKIWIHTEGPNEIVRKVYDGNPPPNLVSNDHMCDTCARMHKCEKTRELIRNRYNEFMPDVMVKFGLRKIFESNLVDGVI